MEQTNNAGASNAQPGAVKPLWEVMNGTTDVIEQIPTQEQIQTKDTVKEETNPATTETPKVETPVVETKTEGAANTDAKPDETKTDAAKTEPVLPTLELSADLIKDAPPTFKEGTTQFYADKLGIELKEDSLEAFQNTFKEKYISKDEAAKMAEINREKFYSEFPPELATAYKMIELGVPPELALNPTAIQDRYLALDDVTLSRETLIQNGMDEADADYQMEQLAANPDNLKRNANIIRFNLNKVREDILDNQKQIYQDLVQKDQQKSLVAKEEMNQSFKKALASQSTFMGHSFPDGLKEKIQAKYDKGLYDNILNDPNTKMLGILYSEVGEKLAQELLSKMETKGENKMLQKLSNVPEQKAQGGSGVQIQPDTTKSEAPLSNFPKEF